MRVSRNAVFALLLAAQPGFGHEFWIDPEDYTVAPGAALTAHLRNGEDFKGITLAWFENRFTRFELVLGDSVIPVQGRAGDTPALATTAPEAEGLLVVLHETAPSQLTYKEWPKFLKFAAHKDFPNAAADHEAAGWPKEGFRESYTRHAKSLIAIGSGAGEDRAFGLATEFVALSNPYEPAFDGEMRVRVLYDGAPRADAQVEVFERAPEGAVTVSLTRTDSEGEASVPVKPGHSYLFDAVVLRPSPEAGMEDRAPVWETLWAALTFSVPE
ncbi:DUF4198 domain-containing protein [Roseobacter sinensis]|uniref:DUF4198 domain-containing protein n=1 Tax=Roseobacter sinensis TaxID=2931391 RepID=A0ABT3BBD8_9RHOB|nr:DUF4198 domain-containing protein [Roseobacter sp. WL0113]MCV3270900.1 DUF4198 domain-containing protein [Roseobacter sp. WL0113]